MVLTRAVEGGTPETVAEPLPALSGAAPTFTYTWIDLPPKDEEGKPYTYAVTEKGATDGQVQVNGNLYTVRQTGNAITNAFVEPKPDPKPENKPVSVALGGQKQAVNHPLKAGEFSFIIKDRQGNTLQIVQNDGAGNFSFAPRTFSRTGIYLYTITEVPGDIPNMTYDSTVYTAKVTISEQDAGLHSRVDLLKDGIPYGGNVRFVNRAKLPPTGDSRPMLLMLLLTLAFIALASAAYLQHCQKRRT